MTDATTAHAWKVTANVPRWVREPVRAPRVGQCRLEVHYAGICGSDLAKLAQAPVPVPAGGLWQPGHEIVGRAIDRARSAAVVINPLQPCGACRQCHDGAIHLCPQLRRIGWDLPGGFTDLLTVPETAVIELPADVRPLHAVAADAMAVAVHGLRCSMTCRPPGQLAVIGSGQIAVCTAVYALTQGWSVTVLARTPSKLPGLRRALPTQVRATAEAAAASFDCVVDAAAGHNAAPLETALRLVRDGGQIVVQNAYLPGVRLGTDLREVFRRSITVTGAFSFCRQDGDDFTLAIDQLRGDPAWVGALLEHRVPMARLPDAIDAANQGRAPIKTVLTTERSRTS